MFCTLDSFSLLWLLNTINCPKPPKSPQFFLKYKPLIVFSMIFSLFCRYPEILTIHCTFLILVDINIHCHIKDIHVCMYIFFSLFRHGKQQCEIWWEWWWHSQIHYLQLSEKTNGQWDSLQNNWKMAKYSWNGWTTSDVVFGSYHLNNKLVVPTLM